MQTKNLKCNIPVRSQGKMADLHSFCQNKVILRRIPKAQTPGNHYHLPLIHSATPKDSLRLVITETESSVCKSPYSKVSHKRNKSFGICPIVCQQKVNTKHLFKRLSQSKGAVTPSHKFANKISQSEIKNNSAKLPPISRQLVKRV